MQKHWSKQLFYQYRKYPLYLVLGLILILMAQPTAFSMLIGLPMLLCGYTLKVITQSWLKDVYEINDLLFPQFPGEKAPLKMTGPYSWMRAPLEIAFFLITFALAVISANIWLIILILFGSGILFYLRFYLAEQNALLYFESDPTLEHYHKTVPVISVTFFHPDQLTCLKNIRLTTASKIIKADLGVIIAILAVLFFSALFSGV
ncbi:MAG: hypothetical protein OXC40_01115 [Proteobacteria bacterium]|nr:hypothetical protein [Pseudomonadota bacterium]